MRPRRPRAGCAVGGPRHSPGQGRLPGGPARGAAGARAWPRRAGRRRPGAQRSARGCRCSARPCAGWRQPGPVAAVCAGGLVRRSRAGGAGRMGAGPRVRARPAARRELYPPGLATTQSDSSRRMLGCAAADLSCCQCNLAHCHAACVIPDRCYDSPLQPARIRPCMCAVHEQPCWCMAYNCRGSGTSKRWSVRAGPRSWTRTGRRGGRLRRWPMCAMRMWTPSSNPCRTGRRCDRITTSR